MSVNYEIPKEFLGGKREDNLYLSNDNVCMLTAMLWASRSKDPSTQVGACYVNENGRIISIGYNGTPNKWSDDEFPWDTKSKDEENIKYPYVIHAEMNGISNYSGPVSDFKNSTIYVTLFPCANCAKLLIQMGIKRVVYLYDTRKDSKDNLCAKILFEKCGVECIDFKTLNKEGLSNINLNLDSTSEKQFINIKKK